MGGCRCSFRSCTIRSDKMTHMFHFPVFEKVRCHKWILNTHRYEFLDLSVSQLRNRVVCQHHFKDECFMNYKKDKLRYDAIPTEGGPFCELSIETNIHKKAAERASLVASDIETESMYIDRKANLSMKYVDFLSNVETDEKNDYWEVPIEKEKPQIVKLTHVVKVDNSLPSRGINNISKAILNTGKDKNKEAICQQNVETENQLQQDLGTQILYPKVDETSKILNNNENLEINNISTFPMATLQGTENLNQYQQPSELMVPLSHAQFTDFNNSSNITYFSNSQHQSFDQSNNNIINNFNPNDSQYAEQHHNKDRVKILSEQTVYQPLPLVGQFVPVLPSLVLQVPDRMKQDNLQMIENTTQSQTLNNVESTIVEQKSNICEIETSDVLKNNDILIKSPPKIEILDIEPSVQKPHSAVQKSNTEVIERNSETLKRLQTIINASQETDEGRTIHNKSDKYREKPAESVSKVSLLKNKVSPERLAAIEKKRIFNKKLRDMVETFLEKPKEREKIVNRSNVIKMKETESSDNSQTRDNALLNTQDKTLTYLEARLQKMENVLLKKIEQNTNSISDLKNSVAPRKHNSIYTQTPCSEQANKMYLYEEISKYLSSKVKDLIYEELFIYKYAENVESIPKRKRRR